ncbi:MAG: hypothetical protein ACRDQ7_04045 [Haloechinothrix sp.]
MPEGYGVELGSLAKTGGEFIELADEARRAKSEFIGSVELHDGQNAGFTTTSKANSLARMWEFHIDDLSKRMAMAGGLLQDSAGTYQELEDAVTASLARLDPEG